MAIVSADLFLTCVMPQPKFPVLQWVDSHAAELTMGVQFLESLPAFAVLSLAIVLSAVVVIGDYFIDL